MGAYGSPELHPAVTGSGGPNAEIMHTIAARLTAQDIRFTMKGSTLYAIVCGWPANGTLTIKSLRVGSPLSAAKVSDVHLLGHPGSLKWTQSESGLTIQLPAQKPGEYAYAFKIAGVAG